MLGMRSADVLAKHNFGVIVGHRSGVLFALIRNGGAGLTAVVLLAITNGTADVVDAALLVRNAGLFLSGETVRQTM